MKEGPASMDEQNSVDLRRDAQQRRQPPDAIHGVHVAADSRGEIAEPNGTSKFELHLHATHDSAELAPWFDGDWWTDLITQFGNRVASIHVEATRGALIHPVVLHHLWSIRRVCPHWRLVGHGFRDDVHSQDEITAVASSPYHEVRFVDAMRNRESTASRLAISHDLDDLFGRIRREQSAAGLVRPILRRMPASQAGKKQVREQVPLPGREQAVDAS